VTDVLARLAEPRPLPFESGLVGPEPDLDAPDRARVRPEDR
jgi:hypothetical protein